MYLNQNTSSSFSCCRTQSCGTGAWVTSPLTPSSCLTMPGPGLTAASMAPFPRVAQPTPLTSTSRPGCFTRGRGRGLGASLTTPDCSSWLAPPTEASPRASRWPEATSGLPPTDILRLSRCIRGPEAGTWRWVILNHDGVAPVRGEDCPDIFATSTLCWESFSDVEERCGLVMS